MSGFLSNDDRVECKVVVNEELQYSIWPREQPCPLGWKEEGFKGVRSDCVAYIDEVWVDMRPRSVRTE
ncbi:MbtH family NRPS accessory protein [Zooshikella marina]|uniref:MbtH family protein n=1 Tax=Zooshikella ganghwensis TaxID=202772 RepID=UPI001BB07F26|nr:MbtH family NRPS accessory protein [Zooshikella ganghwensis]MBU2705624.1 MbtH family NRPS accessory protein [Zooshikella ganghwensis]